MPAATGRDLKAVQAQIDKEGPHAEGSLVLSNLTVSITTKVEHLRKSDRNVIAVLPAAGNSIQQYVLVGAHYDHLGHGESGAMLRAGEENKIHHGADDNASGTAAVLALARGLAEAQARNTLLLKRSIVFAFWSGEELGLIGSSCFVEHPPRCR